MNKSFSEMSTREKMNFIEKYNKQQALPVSDLIKRQMKKLGLTEAELIKKMYAVEIEDDTINFGEIDDRTIKAIIGGKRDDKIFDLKDIAEEMPLKKKRGIILKAMACVFGVSVEELVPKNSLENYPLFADIEIDYDRIEIIEAIKKELENFSEKKVKSILESCEQYIAFMDDIEKGNPIDAIRIYCHFNEEYKEKFLQYRDVLLPKKKKRSFPKKYSYMQLFSKLDMHFKDEKINSWKLHELVVAKFPEERMEDAEKFVKCLQVLMPKENRDFAIKYLSLKEDREREMFEHIILNMHRELYNEDF